MDTEKWINAQKNRLKQNSVIEGPFNCWLCKLGGEKRPYSVLSVKFPWEGKKKVISAHRFSYMIHNNLFEMSKDVHVSHLCHNSRCVNPDHLSYEPENVNKDRQVCRGTFPNAEHMLLLRIVF